MLPVSDIPKRPRTPKTMNCGSAHAAKWYLRTSPNTCSSIVAIPTRSALCTTSSSVKWWTASGRARCVALASIRRHPKSRCIATMRRAATLRRSTGRMPPGPGSSSSKTRQGGEAKRRLPPNARCAQGSSRGRSGDVCALFSVGHQPTWSTAAKKEMGRCLGYGGAAPRPPPATCLHRAASRNDFGQALERISGSGGQQIHEVR